MFLFLILSVMVQGGLELGLYTGSSSPTASLLPTPHYSPPWDFCKIRCLPTCPCFSSCPKLSTVLEDTTALRQS